MEMREEGTTKRFLRPREAAEIAGVSKRTFDDWIRRRVVPHSKIGRVVLIDRDDLEEMVASYRVASVNSSRGNRRRHRIRETVEA
jgi:excisionase family DNA binding protein